MAAGSAAADGLRLIAFGDSLTQGYGLLPEQGLTVRLQEWLAQRGHDVTVINAGVSGDTTSGGAARIDWTLSEPADAIVVELGANDMLRGTDPALVRANLEAILSAVQARGLAAMLVAVPSIANYGPEYAAQFDAIYPELAQQYGALFYPNLLGSVFDAASGGADMNALMQADGMHPSADGVDLIVAAIGPRIEELLALAAR